MYKYVAILDHRTAALMIFCALTTYACLALDFSYNLNITLFSLAVVFPLVFTIREAFKRRDNALEFLSQFKSAMASVHYAFEQSRKLSREQKDYITGELSQISDLFFATLGAESTKNTAAQNKVNGLITFIQQNHNLLSTSVTMKIIRFLQDVNESMENTLSIKLHGTPVSLRAYCLVFVFLFPVIFTPTIVHNLQGTSVWVIYAINMLHGFVLISLYNVQVDMENPFDDIGLDDIKLDGFRFLKMESEEPAAPRIDTK